MRAGATLGLAPARSRPVVSAGFTAGAVLFGLRRPDRSRSGGAHETPGDSLPHVRGHDVPLGDRRGRRRGADNFPHATLRAALSGACGHFDLVSLRPCARRMLCVR